VTTNIKEKSTDLDSFGSIFWQQQLKTASLKDEQGMRWYPAIIRYLHYKSSGCYSTICKAGVLALPSDRTLRDYKHFSSWIFPRAGFGII